MITADTSRADRIYRSTAKNEYGLTDKDLNVLTFVEVRNPHYRSGPPARLYNRAEVEALANSPAVQARLARRAEREDPAAKEARRREREATILRRYQSWREALVPACEAMLNLNRYAKHGSCRESHREEIYELKNGLIALLYREGFCEECIAHERRLPEQRCHACEGTGEHWSGDDCLRCDGTGVYRESRVLRDIAFKFVVDGRIFAWHQPDHLVRFKYTISGTQPGVPAVEKPIEMSKAKMREGKTIIRYVLKMLMRSSADNLRPSTGERRVRLKKFLREGKVSR
jgi:hypothetical protein